MQSLIPAALVGKADILFGNLEELLAFHGDIFLKDLENCIGNTELVALCFTQRVSKLLLIKKNVLKIYIIDRLFKFLISLKLKFSYDFVGFLGLDIVGSCFFF